MKIVSKLFLFACVFCCLSMFASAQGATCVGPCANPSNPPALCVGGGSASIPLYPAPSRPAKGVQAVIEIPGRSGCETVITQITADVFSNGTSGYTQVDLSLWAPGANCNTPPVGHGAWSHPMVVNNTIPESSFTYFYDQGFNTSGFNATICFGFEAGSANVSESVILAYVYR